MQKNQELYNKRKEIGALLKKMREAKSISSEDMALDLGLKENTIIAIESGKFSYDIDIFIKMINYLGLTFFLKLK